MSDVTQILSAIEGGDLEAASKLLPLVYDELRRLAAAKLAEEKPGQTLQATALVHEAYLRLVDVEYSQHWTSRKHFFTAAAEAMRRILVDKARRRNRQKHGGDWQRIVLDPNLVPAPSRDEMLESVDEALEKFAGVDPLSCELVKLRYFAGISLREAAEVLDIAPRTADRLWAYAKAWLMGEIQGEVMDSP
jgi:RNA polymerase sigma factor (TIGR02999 family)